MRYLEPPTAHLRRIIEPSTPNTMRAGEGRAALHQRGGAGGGLHRRGPRVHVGAQPRAGCTCVIFAIGWLVG